MTKWSKPGYLTSAGMVIGSVVGSVVALTVGTALGYDDPIVLIGFGLMPGFVLGAFAGELIHDVLRDVHNDAVKQALSAPRDEHSLPRWWPTDEELEGALRTPAGATDSSDATIIVPSPRSRKSRHTNDLQQSE